MLAKNTYMSFTAENVEMHIKSLVSCPLSLKSLPRDTSSVNMSSFAYESIAYIGYGVYLGQKEAANVRLLSAEAISHVVTIGTQPNDAGLFPSNGIAQLYVHLNDTDDADLATTYDTYQVGRFIKSGTSGHNKTLIHCDKGVSRSAATLIMFLIDEKGHSVEQALKRILGGEPYTRRLSINPRPTFLVALYYREALKGKCSSVRVSTLPAYETNDPSRKKELNEAFAINALGHVSWSGCARDDGSPVYCSLFLQHAQELPRFAI